MTHTGIAGLTLGGGIGWLMRKYGLTIDNLVSVDLITADGGSVIASAEENAELFWGIRGGGGNFGVVTSFEYRLHEIGRTVLAGPIYFSLEDAPKVLRVYRDWIADAPDELMTILNLRRAPAVPFLPEHLHGVPVAGVAVCWCGPIDQGERILRPLREAASPIIDLIAPKPYLTHQSMFDPTVPHGWHYYWKSGEVPALTDHIIDQFVERTATITSPLSYTVAFQLGGAAGRVPEDETAYSHRDAGHNFNINGVWAEGEDAGEDHVAWARGFFSALEPSSLGVYVNFLGDEGEARVRAAYGDAKYERLVQLKRRYDPDNFFRVNQNIPPS